MVAEVRPDLENAITDEIAPTTGDGIRMARELGAKTVDLASMLLYKTESGPAGSASDAFVEKRLRSS